MKKLILIPTLLSVSTTPLFSLAGCNNKHTDPEPPAPPGDYLSIKSDKESKIGIHVVNDDDYNERCPDLWYWDGQKWEDCAFVHHSGVFFTWEITANADNNYTVYLKGSNPGGWSLGNNFNKESIVTIKCLDTYAEKDRAQWTIGGSVMALLGSSTKTEIPNVNCFNSLFEGNKSVVHVDKDFLPATTLKDSCYYEMFYSCTKLQDVPNLPALSVPYDGYCSMFDGCKSIQKGPTKLNARELGDSACAYMFAGCKKLASPARINATNISEYACYSMFVNCESLEIPSDYSLPMTTSLSDSCYNQMFACCKNITRTCMLPTNNLADDCYGGMFIDCPKLKTIKPIVISEYDIVDVTHAFNSMFQITEEVTTTPEYRFIETTGTNAVVDLSDCEIDPNENFIDMFAGRLGVQKPELGKKYVFVNHD